MFFFFFFKQKTAYEMRISDWSSDMCSSDLVVPLGLSGQATPTRDDGQRRLALHAIVDPPEGSRALSEELFGPVMVVIPYDNVQRLCVSLREMEQPLGLYVFPKRSRFVQDVPAGSFSGGVTVNDTMFQAGSA